MDIDGVLGEFKTEERVTKLLSDQGSDLIIEQKYIPTDKTVFMRHYSNPGYGTFAALLFGRWYYDLDKKDLDIYSLEEIEDSLFEFIDYNANMGFYLELLNESPETKEIFSISLDPEPAKVTLKEEGIEYERDSEIILFEKKIVNDCLNSIIEYGRHLGIPNEGFFKMYEYFMNESKKFESPYKEGN